MSAVALRVYETYHTAKLQVCDFRGCFELIIAVKRWIVSPPITSFFFKVGDPREGLYSSIPNLSLP